MGACEGGGCAICKAAAHTSPPALPACLPACSQVIPPEEIAVSFEDIGALDSVKTTLHEVRAREHVAPSHLHTRTATSGARPRPCQPANPDPLHSSTTTTAPVSSTHAHEQLRDSGGHLAPTAPRALHPRHAHQAHQGPPALWPPGHRQDHAGKGERRACTRLRPILLTARSALAPSTPRSDTRRSAPSCHAAGGGLRVWRTLYQRQHERHVSIYCCCCCCWGSWLGLARVRAARAARSAACMSSRPPHPAAPLANPPARPSGLARASAWSARSLRSRTSWRPGAWRGGGAGRSPCARPAPGRVKAQHAMRSLPARASPRCAA